MVASKNLWSVMILRISSSVVKPQNVCEGGVSCTLNTRYEDAAIRDYISLRHYPKTAWMYVYETL